MDEFLSFKPFRNQEWRRHSGIKGVRRAIEWDNSNTLVIFERVAPGEEWHGYVVVPRDRWLERFGAKG
jgi:hypothetical protein